MQKLSLTLNAVLIAAVAYLYFLHFKSPSASSEKVEADSAHVVIQPKEIKPSSIVFINADTLTANYNVFKELKSQIEARHSALESQLNVKAQKFQKDYMDYQQRASQGQITVDQAKATEEDLVKRKAELDEMEAQLGKVYDDMQLKNIEIQKKVMDYLREYNKNGAYSYIMTYTANGGNILYAKDSLEITKEIVDGLNARYKEEKLINSNKK